MILIPKIPNLTLIPATLATHFKYDVLDFGDSTLSNPYPLVPKQGVLKSLTLKSESDQMTFYEAVVSISRDNNIVATPVLGGKGTVKEMITPGDLQLDISLAIVSTTADGDYRTDEGTSSQTDVYPYKGVERLRKMLDEECRLYIVSDFLQRFDLDGGDFGIVITSYSLAEETHTNRQVVNIKATSDYDYNLIIKE